MRTSVSILPVDFRFQAENPYTRFSEKASCVQSLLFGCRAGILFDFQTIIARGPEILTGEPGEIDEDGWHVQFTLYGREPEV